MRNGSEVYKSYEYFLHAIRFKVKQRNKEGKKVKQKDVANAIDCSPVHLSGILSVKQTRKASPRLQESIAGYFEMTLGEFLDLGRELYEGTTPVEDQKETPFSPAQSSHPLVEENLTDLAMQVATSAKRTQNELYRLRAIIEMIGDAVSVVSRDLLIEYQNHAHREMFDGNLIGEKCCDFRACSIDTTCPTKKALESGKVQHAIMPFADKKISITASPFHNASGLVIGTVNTFRDVSQTQELLDENIAMRERLAATLEKVEDGVMLYDQDRRIIFYNKKFKDISSASERNLETTDTLAQHTRRQGIVTNMDEIQEAMKEAFVSKRKASVRCFKNDGSPATTYTVEPITAHDGKFLGFMATNRIAK